MKRIINEENNWDHNVEADTKEGAVVWVGREEVAHALFEAKTLTVPNF